MSEVMTEVVDHYICDSCGNDFHDKPHTFLTAYSDGLIAQWWPHGDYCEECLGKLLDVILKPIERLERYCNTSSDEAKRTEVAMIRGEGGD